MSKNFVFLTPYVRYFSITENEPQMTKRLNQFLATVPEDIHVVVVAEEPAGCNNHLAYVSEHYNLAVLNPSRILVREDLIGDADKVDFSWLCRLFLKEDKFAVFEKKPGAEPGRRFAYPKRREGTYGTSVEEYGDIRRLVLEQYGELLPFFQMLMITDMCHLFSEPGEAEAAKLRELLQEMDDDIICGTGCIPEDILIGILSLKYGTDIEREFVYRSGKLRYDNFSVVALKEIPFVVEYINIVKGKINIRGQVMLPLQSSEIEYFLMDNSNRRYEISFTEEQKVSFLGKLLHTRKQFQFELPLGNKTVGLRFMYRYREKYQARVRMEFDESIGLVPDSPRNCCARDGYLCKVEKRILFVAPLKIRTRMKLFFTSLLLHGKALK